MDAETKTDRFVDRTGWAPGPWDDEPDRREWRYDGLPCLIVRSNGGGALCGYVGVPASHPWYGRGYDGIDCDVEVHGGLTYSDRCAGHICHVPKPGESDDVWWLGFDCAHAYDIRPAHDALNKRYDIQPQRFGGDVYRDIDYVRGEVESLARQVLAAAP